MYTLNVEGMHCGACAKAVTRAIQKRDPGAQVNVRIAEKQVEVKSDQIGLDELAEAVEEAGYRVVG